MVEYKATKKCKPCGKEFQIVLTKYEAAFDALSNKKVRGAKCPDCGSEEYQSTSIQPPPVDEDILLRWANDENLYFLSQDEDLMLAEKENIGLIEQFIQRNDILSFKRDILLSVLCVIVYDRSEGHKEALDVLLKHKDLLDAARPQMYDYIGKNVFPKLGLKW